MKKSFFEMFEMILVSEIMKWILILSYVIFISFAFWDSTLDIYERAEVEISKEVNQSVLDLKNVVNESKALNGNKLAEFDFVDKKTLFMHNIDGVDELGNITVVIKSDDGVTTNILYQVSDELLEDVSRLNTVDQYVLKGKIIKYDKNSNSYTLELTGVQTLNDYLK